MTNRNTIFCVGQTTLGVLVASLVIRHKLDGNTSAAPPLLKYADAGAILEPFIEINKRTAPATRQIAEICGFPKSTKLYVGSEAYVQQCLSDPEHAPMLTLDKLVETDIERRFAVGIYSLIEWEWITWLVKTFPKNNYFEMRAAEEVYVPCILLTDKSNTPIGFKIQIGTDDPNLITNISIWKALNPRDTVPTDKELLSFDIPSHRSNDIIHKIQLPVIERDAFTRPDYANQTSFLVNKPFVYTDQYYRDSGYAITKFTQHASMTLNHKGGWAEATTMIVIERGMSIDRPDPGVLDLTDAPLMICITRKLTPSAEIPLFVGYYHPPNF
jgi:hypothetical protein